MNTTSTGLANLRCARAALRTCAARGIRRVVISSGARCAPLVLAASQLDELSITTHPDERAAAFMALGMAQADGIPAMLICTSGTATANYLPSIIEAHLSRIPLIVLTADRPPELRHCGAPQTIRQVGLYGDYVKCSVDLPPPDDSNGAIARVWAREAAQAIHLALSWPMGPVHLNLPFREPLLPEPSEAADAEGDSDTGEFPEMVIEQAPSGAPGRWDHLARVIAEHPRGLIVAGPMHGPPNEDIVRLAAACGYPILADIASQLRTATRNSQLFAMHDLLLRHPDVAKALIPDVVIRFGGLPTSKLLSQWLAADSVAHHIVIDDAPIISDPFKSATEMITASPPQAACELHARVKSRSGSPSMYTEQWRRAEQAVAQVREKFVAEQASLYEGEIVARVFAKLPPQTSVMLGNSMPIRWADTHAGCGWGDAPIFFNRGANGIDGVLSTAVGASLARGRKVVLIIGDMSLLHDLNGLFSLGQQRPDVTVVLLNNDGGGIFSFLPLATQQSIFESLVAMPHGRDFAHVARFFDVPHSVCDSASEMDAAIESALQRRGPEIIEFQTDRQATHDLTKALYERVAASEIVVA